MRFLEACVSTAKSSVLARMHCTALMSEAACRCTQAQALLRLLWVHVVPVIGGLILCIALWNLLLSAVRCSARHTCSFLKHALPCRAGQWHCIQQICDALFLWRVKGVVLECSAPRRSIRR